MDNDGNLDIVLLANSIPHNGAYKPAGTSYPDFTSYWSNPGVYLDTNDLLSGVDTGIGTWTNFNPVTVNQPWFMPVFFSTLKPWVQTELAQGLHLSPPSPNIVMGLLNSYVGSDVAWLKGDGRGHFNLMFVTPINSSGVREPVRIRKGISIKLAKLGPGFPGFPDIVLTSANDMGTGNYVVRVGDTSSVEPFSGTGRVFWLENRGVVGGNLEFRDHGIAEYQYDRMPLLFHYEKDKWEDPFCSLFPSDFEIADIDFDGRDDILMPNLTPHSRDYTGGTITYTGFNPNLSTLVNNYTGKLNIPAIGDLWFANSNFDYTKSLIYYRNEPGSGPQFSTASFRTAWVRNGGAIEPFAQKDHTTNGIIRLRIGSHGEEAYSTLFPKVVFRREIPIVGARPFTLLGRSPNISKTNEWGIQVAADMNGDGRDELVYNEFWCGPTGGNCTAWFHIYSVIPNGTDDVTVTEEHLFPAENDNYSRHIAPPFVVVDINGDNRRDIIVPNNENNEGPFLVYLNQSSLNQYSFKLIKQQNPVIKWPSQWVENRFSHFAGNSATSLNPHAFLSAGDFNEDGFPDIVRTGPSFRATLFLNDLPGLQRARVNATAIHDTGKRKTWTSILGGVLTPTGVSISTAPTGAIGFHSVDTQ